LRGTHSAAAGGSDVAAQAGANMRAINLLQQISGRAGNPPAGRLFAWPEVLAVLHAEGSAFYSRTEPSPSEKAGQHEPDESNRQH
jgi:hypothetical protein